MTRPDTDAGMVAAMIQGGLAMAASQMAGRLLTKPAAIEQGVDDQGIYEDFFRIRLASGSVVKITVVVELDTTAGQSSESQPHIGAPLGEFL